MRIMREEKNWISNEQEQVLMIKRIERDKGRRRKR